MDYTALTSAKGDPLPLASLRLLVPPLHLMSASMWRILKKQDVMSYWKVSEFVSFVMETVPELVLLKHWTQLNLGLRARFIFELFRRGEDHELIQSHLEKIKPQQSTQQGEMSEEEKAAINFLELIHALLKDDQERQDFIQEVYPKEYGPQYDSDLQMLLWEFLCRLDQLLPVPELEQTVSWLGESSGLEDFTKCVSKPTHMKNLLQHHKQLGHLEQHVPPSSMGDHILSSLTAALQYRQTKHEEQRNLECPSKDPQPLTFVEDIAMEIITVTEYAEVELSANTDIEVLIEDTTHNSTIAEDGTVIVLSENVSKDMQESEVIEEKLLNGLSNTEIIKEDSQVTEHKPTSGPHDCPDCNKKFKFASSLIAHRVIHTGERPHKCGECGRCFSFRQSLERHRNMHKIRKSYECAVCGESFRSVAARTVHKQMHMEHGVYSCQKCNKKFSQELALARHMKTHTDDNADKDIVESNGELEVISEAATPSEEQSKKTNCECNTSDTGVIDPQLMNEVISLVKVRTSGRKRKPTMKVQMIHLQKTNKRQKEAEKVKDAEMKPVPFASTEHSYGSSVACSKEDDEGPVAEGQHAAFSCPKCDYCHSEEAQVQQHINKTHSIKPDEETQATQPPPDIEGRFSCSDCDKTFRFHSLLKAHQRIHTGEQPYLCSQCGRRFSFRQSLERHRLTHKSGRKYECLICGEFFKSLVAQREHSGAHMENGEYVCTECGRTFAWKSALVRHLKTHSSEVEKGVFTCPHCKLDFNCASSLNRHLQTHQEERVHVCNCGKSFAYKAALTAHQRVHQKDRPHVCGQCGKGFLYRGGLSSHQKIHSQEMPFMCSYCGKSFKRERNMKKHERCHTRENVFQCSQCDKGFVYKATLTRHELTHSGERPYLCADCGKGFFSHAELLKHERFHTGHKPFQCSHCGKRFTQSCYLTIHLRYHTGVKPYACSECDKSFLSANRLKRHQRTHSGEKPYVCGECGKGFRQSYHLKMHQRTHAIKLM